jgi:hypothetical protein
MTRLHLMVMTLKLGFDLANLCVIFLSRTETLLPNFNSKNMISHEKNDPNSSVLKIIKISKSLYFYDKFQ